MLDLLVIGAGLTGLSAALTAAQAGLRVRVVATGLGSLHWHAGTLDVLGYLPTRQTAVSEPFGAFDALPARHPYRRLGAPAVAEAVSHLANTFTQAGLDFSGPGADDAEEPAAAANLLLPSAVGAARPTWRAPAAQRDGDLAQERPMLLVGFGGLRDYYPALMAEHLCQQGFESRCVWLPLDVITRRSDSNNVHLAQEVDAPGTAARLVAAVKPLIQSGERVGFPAILGLARYHEVLAELRAGLDAPVFEIPTLPPSVPGIRIHRALIETLSGLGVRVEAGMKAIGFAAEGRAIRSVETATASRPLRHRAAAYLLATGGILGGGFTGDPSGQIRETLFDLPLHMPAGRGAWFRSEFLDSQGHPIFSGGIEVNDAFQPCAPLAQAGESAPCFENLWAAGNGLAHCDAIRTRSLEGVAIATGVAAARAVVKRTQ